MSQNPQIEALKEARQFILAPAEDLLWGVVHRIDAALSASQEAAAPSEEPVAWRLRGKYKWFYRENIDGNRAGWLPLYDHPSVASPAVAPVAVSVKPLQWVERPYAARQWAASSVAGDYFAGERDGVAVWNRLLEAGRPVANLEAAKAAAQSDFNARILSSIIPATKGGEDELRRAWEYGRTSWCPAGILTDKERTESEWRKALAALSAQDTDGVAK